MKKSPEGVIGDLVGRLIGQFGYYFLLKRMGAPKYVAFIAAGINAHLHMIANPVDEEEVAAAIITIRDKWSKN